MKIHFQNELGNFCPSGKILKAFVAYKNKRRGYGTRVEFRVIFWNNQTVLGGQEGNGNTWVGLDHNLSADWRDPFGAAIEGVHQLTLLHTPICSLIKLIPMMVLLLFLSTESFLLSGPLNMGQWIDFNTSILGGDSGVLGYLDYY